MAAVIEEMHAIRADVDKALRTVATAAEVFALYPHVPSALAPSYLEEKAAYQVACALVRADALELRVEIDDAGTGFCVASQSGDDDHHVTFDYWNGRWTCDCKAMAYGRVWTCVHCATIRLRAWRSHGTRVYQRVARAWHAGTRRLSRLTA